MVPIAPEAPARLSATIGWLLRYFEACAARLRPDRSESPPAANGMMKVIGFDGYPCANAGDMDRCQAKSEMTSAASLFMGGLGIRLRLCLGMHYEPVEGPGVWY